MFVGLLVCSPHYHCPRSENTIFTSIIRCQCSNQDQEQAKEKQIPYFKRSLLRGEPGNFCYKSLRKSPPSACDLCLVILIEKNVNSGCRTHLESKWLYLGISQCFESQQAGLSQQTALLLSNQADLPEPAQLCSQESKQGSSQATLTANKEQNGTFCTPQHQGPLRPSVMLTKYLFLRVS